MRNNDRPFSDNDRAILQPLDGSVGPAVPLSDEETAFLAQKIIERSLQKPSSWPAFFSAAAAVWLLIGLSGTAAAAVAAYLLLRQPEMREAKSKEDSVRTQPARAKVISPAIDERYNADGPKEASSTSDKPDNIDRSSSADKPGVANQKAIAADVLERANRLRASRRWRAAERLYTRVYRTHPRSQKARPAMVAAASLRLEYLNDARGALRLFRKVVRETGAASVLAEQACFGIPEAYRALGDTAAEIKTLKRFLSTYPSSVLAPRARQRLEHITADHPEIAPTGPSSRKQ